MSNEAALREFAHQAVDRADVAKIRAILELLDDEYFTPEQIAEIHEMDQSDEWYDWRDVRRDV